MNSARVSDIPDKIRIKNIDPSKSSMNVAGLVCVPHDGKHHERNLASFRPELRQKAWDALQVMQRSGLVEVEILKDELGATAVKTEETKHIIPPPEVGDDFIKVGCSEIVQKRLYANKIRTYEDFLDTDEETLFRMDGLDKKNVPAITEKIVALMETPANV